MTPQADGTIPRKRRQRPLPVIAGRHFLTVKTLEESINEIRKNYRPHDEPVRGAEGAFLMAWMRHHDSLEDAEEIHGELQHIHICHNPDVFRKQGRPESDQYQVRLFFADGYSKPFSYRADSNNFGIVDDGCAASRTRLRWINRAGRCLIQDQIEEHRQVHLEFDGICEISGCQLTSETADIHHATISFKWLLFNFLKSWCIETGQNANHICVHATDDVGGYSFDDDRLCEAWMTYHADRAVLQVLDKAVHFEQHIGATKPPWAELFAPPHSPAT